MGGEKIKKYIKGAIKEEKKKEREKRT